MFSYLRWGVVGIVSLGLGLLISTLVLLEFILIGLLVSTRGPTAAVVVAGFIGLVGASVWAVKTIDTRGLAEWNTNRPLIRRQDGMQETRMTTREITEHRFQKTGCAARAGSCC